MPTGIICCGFVVRCHFIVARAICVMFWHFIFITIGLLALGLFFLDFVHFLRMSGRYLRRKQRGENEAGNDNNIFKTHGGLPLDFLG